MRVEIDRLEAIPPAFEALPRANHGIATYRTRIARFLQADPLGYGAGMNMYGYVGGDPVNFTDPSGSVCVKWQNVTYTYRNDKLVDRQVNDTWWEGECGIDAQPTGLQAGLFGRGKSSNGQIGGLGAAVAHRRRLTQCEIGVLHTWAIETGTTGLNFSDVEFRRGLDLGANAVTFGAYHQETTGAVTQRDIIYVKDSSWDRITNPFNQEFWHELRHVVQFQLGNLNYATYAAASALAALGGGDSYLDNSFERSAENYGAMWLERYRRTGCR